MKQKAKALFSNKQIGLYASVAGSLIMGTIHLTATIRNFSWLTFNYCLFCYLLALIRILLTWFEKTERKSRIYLAGALSHAVLLIPMTVAMVKTILEKDAPAYIFFWMIYLYATYGTVKFILAVRSRHKARKSRDAYGGVISWLSLVSAAYTLQMMESALISTFDTENHYSMILLQYFSHGAILFFCCAIVVHLYIKFKKQERSERLP